MRKIGHLPYDFGMSTMRILSTVALTLTLGAMVYGVDREVPEPIDPTLPWYSDLDEALAAAKKAGRPILLEFR